MAGTLFSNECRSTRMSCCWIFPEHNQASPPQSEQRAPNTWRIELSEHIAGLWHDQWFVFWQSIERGPVQIQMGCNQFRRRVRQPLGEREVLVVAALEHLQEFQICAAGVFDVVRQRLLDVADVARFEIHRSGASSRRKYSHAPFAADVELPLIRIRMPVQFAHTARFYRDNRGGDGGGNLEAAG